MKLLFSKCELMCLSMRLFRVHNLLRGRVVMNITNSCMLVRLCKHTAKFEIQYIKLKCI